MGERAAEDASAGDAAAQAEAARAERKARDIAFVLPLIGLIAFSPPFIVLFAGAETLFGAPLIVVYVFAAWIGLIIAARAIVEHLPDEPDGR